MARHVHVESALGIANAHCDKTTNVSGGTGCLQWLTRMFASQLGLVRTTA